MSILSKILGDPNERYVKSVRPLVEEINKRQEAVQKLSDDKLRGLTAALKERLTQGETLDDLLPEAYAAVREAARRMLGQRHFDVQLIGGIALHQGRITEMRTGEGKTLVATLPIYLNSLAGKGVHLVTPNDYLSRVGAGWMGPVYHALGASVAVIAHDFSGIYDPDFKDPQPHGDDRLSHFRPSTRPEAYQADITYGTNNEFGFDYLRDNLEQNPADMRQREHAFAIVDEIDSILIDEARTPLIISMPDAESGELYRVFAGLMPQLKENEDYNIDEKLKTVSMSEAGIDKMEKLLDVGNIYEEKGMRFVRHLESALRARALFHRDKDYVVREGKVIIVDEFTGRLMPGRRWAEGLHQAVEAKEGVQIERESRTVATITFQNYFRMYAKLAGMTGTAETSAEEFHKVYNLDVVSIPTHRPMIRQDLPDLVFRTEKGKLQAVVREVQERHKKGQPVLIGTVSIEKNERLSKMLQIAGVPHELLNAKNHEREAMIIAEAGRRGAVTVATNMAGRGVDIILGGPQPVRDEGRKTNDEGKKEYEDVRNIGGLHVIGTQRHEARRIDNQLRGRAGRQGDPGSSQFLVSFEDDLMRIFGADRMKRMMEALGVPEDQPVENRMVTRAIESAQEKIEGFHFDSRKHVLEYDDVLNKQRDSIYRMRKEILFLQSPEAQAQNAAADQNGQTESSVSQPSILNSTPLRERILEMVKEETTRFVESHTEGNRPEEWNMEEMFETARALAAVSDDVHTALIEIKNGEGGAEQKRDRIRLYLLRTLNDLYEAREGTIGANSMRNVERLVMLRSVDMLWMDHLDQMEHLRDSVRLRAYGQREPLVEYKNEGARLFRDLQSAIRTQVVNNIFKVGTAPRQDTARNIELHKPDASSAIVPPAVPMRDPVLLQMNASEPQSFATVPRPQGQLKDRGRPSYAKAAVGRNDPCFCGSGRKYKKCHGR